MSFKSTLASASETKKQTMYLAIMIGICYNADRQKDKMFPCETAKRKSPDARPGIFYSV